MIPEIETQIGASLSRIVADRGYRGHNARPDHKMKVYVSGQKRGLTERVQALLGIAPGGRRDGPPDEHDRAPPGGGEPGDRPTPPSPGGDTNDDEPDLPEEDVN